jgi:hypothetical protein
MDTGEHSGLAEALHTHEDELSPQETMARGDAWLHIDRKIGRRLR